MVIVKILNYDIFNEGIIFFEINNKTTLYEILKKIDEKYGDIYEKKVGRKFLNDINSSYRIFLNNNYLDISTITEQEVKNEDHILILKPISGG
jgi:molybdopterin converting factor small subunit